jgi:exopolysaccharide biosynthesis polyprenyl glycosylphosphotransferase
MMIRARKLFAGWILPAEFKTQCSWLHSVERMQAIVNRERLRADRGQTCFSTLTLNLTHYRERDVNTVARTLQERIRVTDDAGHLGPGRIAVVLPETSAAGAWKLADDICRLLPADVRRPECDVYEYPTDEDAGGRGSESKQKVRPMHELIVEPLPVWKRAIDVLGAGTALVVAAPLMLLVILLIKWQSPGPALYQHERIGRHRRRFKVWKFRTMVCNADRMLNDYLAAHPQYREEWEHEHKLKNDPRITPIGRWLRKTSIDELPQLWNVLCGEMSLVGPRPIVTAEVAKYDSKIGPYCNVLPGITGMWQISGRNDTTYAQRVELDSYYARNCSLWLDVFILVKTVRVVLLRQGAY